MTKDEIHEHVVNLTLAIFRTGIASEASYKSIFCKSPENIRNGIKNFPKQYPELYCQIVQFGNDFNETVEKSSDGRGGEIFGMYANRKNGIHEFDSNQIHPISFYFLAVLGNINEADFFICQKQDPLSEVSFINGLKELGYHYLAEFVANTNWQLWVGEGNEYPTFEELLKEIMLGKFSA